MRVPKALSRKMQKELLMRFGIYEIVYPEQKTLSRNVPKHIDNPYNNEKIAVPEKPEIKDENQINGMRSSCKLAANILGQVEKIIKPGLTTDSIDELVHNLSIEAGAYPSPLRYKGFPKSVCTSVNNVAVHGIPDLRSLRNGDIVNVDITKENTKTSNEKKGNERKGNKNYFNSFWIKDYQTTFLVGDVDGKGRHLVRVTEECLDLVYYKGFHGDCSKTFLVGDVDGKGRHLVRVTEECLDLAIQTCGPDVPYYAIGAKISAHAKRNRLTVLPACIGHGIGSYFHGPPDIYHFYSRKNIYQYPGLMQPGMTFTIEPVLSHGGELTVVLDDNWTVVTADGSRAAQAEHTILITENGAEILTK